MDIILGSLIVAVGTIIAAAVTLFVRSRARLAISGSVFFDDGLPVVGAVVSVEGDSSRAITDDIGFFAILVRRQEIWVVRTVFGGQSRTTYVQRDNVNVPVRVQLSGTNASK